MARFEVLAREADRDLIRALAKALSGDGTEADRIRATVTRAVSREQLSNKGGILNALRRSPMVGASLNLKRQPVKSRRVDV